MRLLELNNILSQLLNDLNFAISQPDGTGNITLSGMRSYRMAVEQAEELNLFKAEINRLKEAGMLASLNDRLTISNDNAAKIGSLSADLRSQVQRLKDAISPYFTDSDDLIALKLPALTNFEDLANVFSRAQKSYIGANR